MTFVDLQTRMQILIQMIRKAFHITSAQSDATKVSFKHDNNKITSSLQLFKHKILNCSEKSYELCTQKQMEVEYLYTTLTDTAI